MIFVVLQNGKDFREKVTFGVSKSLCEKCEDGIGNADISGKPGKEVIDYGQHEKPGLPAERVQNWEIPSDVKVTPLQEMEARAKGSTINPSYFGNQLLKKLFKKNRK